MLRTRNRPNWLSVFVFKTTFTYLLRYWAQVEVGLFFPAMEEFKLTFYFPAKPLDEVSFICLNPLHNEVQRAATTTKTLTLTSPVPAAFAYFCTNKHTHTRTSAATLLATYIYSTISYLDQEEAGWKTFTRDLSKLLLTWSIFLQLPTH